MSLSGSDLDIFRGLVLLAVLVGFVGIWVWAWGNKRKSRFRDASLLPLEEDEVAPSATHGVNNGSDPC